MLDRVSPLDYSQHPGERWCSRHKQWLPEEQFHKGNCNYCKDCRSLYHKERYDATKKQKANRKANYGNEILYDQLLAFQGGVCAICKQPQKLIHVGRARTPREDLYMDHDHQTGKVRGLLCHRCNYMLGWLSENAATVDSAREYLANNGVVGFYEAIDILKSERLK